MIKAILPALLTLLVPTVADAAATVRFMPVETVSTFEFRDVAERDRLCRDVADDLRRLAERSLPPGTDLVVDLLDVTPAGRLRPSFSGDDIRVVSDVTPPRIRLRYALKERGRTVAGGEETVSDPNVLWDVSARTSLASNPYEKELLRDWFQKRIVARRAPLR